ncbi:MAG: MATE family efflux transporter [Defluviitaleaceae bacterium]|nr:MATE family efflux transporter [Defluviitaleaceae bacterium]
MRRLVSTAHMVKPDLRRGEITPTREAYKTSLGIAIPAVVEMVSLALMDIISMIMVGRLGDFAISSVALTAQPRMIFFSVFFALNVSVTAIIARAKGAGEEEKARSCLRHALLLIIILGTLMTVLAVFFARPMMLLAGAQADTIGPAASYFRIAGYGLIFQVATGTICAAQRATGNTKITLKVSVTAKIVQVLFNFLLIDGRFGFPAMGIDGAAVSIVIVGVVGFCLAFTSILQKDSFLRLRLTDNWKPDPEMARTIGRLSLGSAIEQVGLRIGFFLYARVVADLGTLQFAAHSIAMQLLNLSFTFADGIGAATTSLVGQNLGKKRPDLSIMYGKLGMRLAFAAAAFLSITAFFIRYWFTGLFTDDPYVLELTVGLFILIIVILPIQTTQVVMGGSLRGAGDVRYVAMTMFVTVGVLRPLTGFVLAYPLGLGLMGAWIAIIIDQAVRLCLLFFRFSGGKWIRAKL